MSIKSVLPFRGLVVRKSGGAHLLRKWPPPQKDVLLIGILKIKSGSSPRNLKNTSLPRASRGKDQGGAFCLKSLKIQDVSSHPLSFPRRCVWEIDVFVFERILRCDPPPCLSPQKIYAGRGRFLSVAG